jgi:hypothetical protein
MNSSALLWAEFNLKTLYFLKTAFGAYAAKQASPEDLREFYRL